MTVTGRVDSKVYHHVGIRYTSYDPIFWCEAKTARLKFTQILFFSSDALKTRQILERPKGGGLNEAFFCPHQPFLVCGWTNPLKNTSQNWITSPRFGVNMNIWNHQPDPYLLNLLGPALNTDAQWRMKAFLVAFGNPKISMLCSIFPGSPTTMFYRLVSEPPLV